MAYCRNGTTDNRECVQYEDGMFDDHTPPTAPALTITNVARTKREAARPTPSPLSPKHIRLTINNQDYVGPTTSINNVKGELNDMKFSRIVSTIADNTSVSNATRAPFAARNTGICSDDSDNDQPALIQCKPTTKYTKHGLIGQGSYGSVQVGKNHENGQIVAIKTMNCKTDPRISYIQQIAFREVQILRRFKHENIINLLDVLRLNQDANNTTYDLDLVFEYCRFELSKIIANPRVELKMADIKNLINQLFTGLDFIHGQNVMHRDIKTDNVLLTVEGVLKIADFGLARPIPAASDDRTLAQPLTTPVVTLWYRAPELLLGATDYTIAVDQWSAGCVMAEFWTRKAILTGNTEKAQIMNVLSLCGSISWEEWPDVKNLPIYQNVRLPRTYKRIVDKRLEQYTKNQKAIGLLNELLELNPAKRISSRDALNHDFFFSAPFPSDLKEFMTALRQVSWA